MQATNRPTGTRITPQQAMAAAHKLYAGGKLDDALKVLSATLKALPNHPDAHHLVGVILQAKGDPEGGIRYVEQAVSLAPSSAQFKANLTEMYRRFNRLDDAVRVGRLAAEQAPDLAIAHGNLGVAYYDKGDLDAARDCQMRALEINANLPQALNNLGSIARDCKELDEATEWYRKALTADPNYIEAAGNLGTALIEAERTKEALDILLPLVRKDPKRAETHCSLGRAFLQLNDLDRAEIGFRQALKVSEPTYQMYLGMSQVMQEKNHPDLALAEAEKAVALAPDKAVCHHQVGLCSAELSYPLQAVAAYEKALFIDPDFVPTILASGYLEMESGDMAAAGVQFRRATELKPDDLSGRLAMVRLSKIKADDPDFGYLLSQLPQADSMPPKKALSLHFALGKCREDVGEHAEAFESFSNGCAIKRSMITYDADATDARAARIIEMFTPEKLDQLREAANLSAKPIFVLGMPRSGTTLTETILASHPDVFGAGELNNLQRLFPVESGPAEQHYPGVLTKLDAAELSSRTATYLKEVAARAPEAARITDKMPANFHYVGLIHALLPNARIVHVQRDPADTCLSCYTRLFERSQYQSYDQVEIARYYLAYRKIMDHWRALLPDTAFLDFSYEDLVGDFETQARRLVNFCGLSWNDACLDFHKTKRSVRTASVTQVRQPVYGTSVRKWKAYEPYIGKMLETLGDLVAE